jgi:hypothetical protein
MSPASTDGTGSMTGSTDVSGQSVGELVANLGETSSRLLRQEVALAKTEIRSEVQATGRALGTLTVAGGLALVALTMFSLSAARWISEYLDLGWAYLIVGTLWTVTAGILYASARSALHAINPVPERTRDTLDEIPNAVRGR